MTVHTGFDSDFDPDTDTDPDPDDKLKHKQLSGQGATFSLGLRAWPELVTIRKFLISGC
ncbi:hypothetical protein Dthio_PD2660 [Desulfonatronospira thiodismutans ASO3-1]|uniref:Uncharacterized protein n=1 Tax=Desulfonatronospira thiodismutans ASO3-1 TaxID=555779 RepID=D6SKN8_9BACT|nr:hypothetical protein Dthio_PD2660 [Desulfonatronospira thiodismutans ASO3-1]